MIAYVLMEWRGDEGGHPIAVFSDELIAEQARALAAPNDWVDTFDVDHMPSAIAAEAMLEVQRLTRLVRLGRHDQSAPDPETT